MLRISNRKKHNVSHEQVVKLYNNALKELPIGITSKDLESHFHFHNKWVIATLEEGRAVFYIMKLSEVRKEEYHNKIKPNMIDSQSVSKAIITSFNNSNGQELDIIKHLEGEFSKVYTAEINGFTY